MDPRAVAGCTVLLVVLMLSAEAGSEAVASTKDPELPSVPAPTNVLIKSYNLNPTLYWDYQDMPQTPTFSAQVLVRKKWIDACINISDHHCDIYEQIKNPDTSVWARVKANLGQKESLYAHSKEFIMCQHGKVGPVDLDIRRSGDQLIVNVFHPVVIVNGERRGIMFENDAVTCYTFFYTIYVQKNISGKILYTNHKTDIEDCNETLCQFNMTISTLDSEYCVSVDGFSEYWVVRTEKSRDVCVSLVHNNRKDSIWILIVVPFTVFLMIALVFACWYFKKNPSKRKSIPLPKSLLSVVKNATSETKPVTSYQPVLENEVVICEARLATVTVPDNPGATEHEDLSKGTEAMIPEGGTVVVPDSPPTPIKRGSSSLSGSNQSEPDSITTYHSRNGSDSGLVQGSDSFISDSEFPPHNNPETTAEQEPTPVRKALTSFGYDKPHVLVDVLVDGDTKESLIGYRPTTEAEEPS